MLERPEVGEKAILVHLQFRQGSFAYLESDRDEFIELARSAGAMIAEVYEVIRDAPDAKHFIGSGKAQELAEAVDIHQATVVLFNTNLSPSQERNLEAVLKCRVVDRTGLILDIFAQRARTFEGKLQVELAQLEHQSTRLVRGWTHLERQKGGIGLRGPGETQLETDRRLIRQRISYIKARLEKVRKQRQQSRHARQKADVLTISLVGYTNAGKSTLFNKLTDSHVWAVNQLFATLDPTLRHLDVVGLGRVVLADTVGFIQHLPHGLIDAFRATLEEVKDADLLLHVIDLSNEEWERQVQEVEAVLEQISAAHVPRLSVYNKIDLVNMLKPQLGWNQQQEIDQVWISAKQGLGLDFLQEAMIDRLSNLIIHGTMRIPANDAAASKLRAYLFSENAVASHQFLETGEEVLSLRLRETRWHQLCRKMPKLLDWFESGKSSE